MSCPNYPAVTLQQATDLVVRAANDLSQVINGLATGEVELCDGDVIPTLRKALLDNFYFLPAIPYVQGTTNEVYNQLYIYEDYLIYSPAATASNPITLVEFPLSSGDWQVFSGTGQTISFSPREVGDGVTDTFSSPSTEYSEERNFIVTQDGVRQRPIDDYTVDSSGNIVFVEAPEEGVNIDIMYFNRIVITSTISTGFVATPNSSTDSGELGQWSVDNSYTYYYVGDGITHEWKRVALSSW